VDGLRGGHTEFAGDGRLSAHQRYALDERDAMIERDGYNCWRCGVYLPGQRGARAHRVARTKPNLERFGPYVLDHRLNIRHSCERCNSYAMLFSCKGDKIVMLEEIKKDLEARGLPTNGAAYKARRKASKAEADRKKREQKREERAREREEARRNSRSAERVAMSVFNERTKLWYQQNKQRVKERLREQRRAAGKSERMVWADDSAKEIRKQHQRLGCYLQRMRKKYGQRYTYSMTPHEIDMVEKHRLAVEQAIAAGKKIRWSEREKT
jgi:hypothetical protein